MATKVRDIVGMGDAFQGSIKAALGCTPSGLFPGQYRVLTQDNKVLCVCAQHLEPTVRQEVIRTGTMVVVGHATGEHKCQFERLPMRGVPTGPGN